MKQILILNDSKLILFLSVIKYFTMPLPAAVPLVATGLGLLGEGFNFFSSMDARDQARRRLRELGKTPLPEYTETPEMRGIYNIGSEMVSSPRGYTPSQRAGFRTRIGRSLNAMRSGVRNIVGGSQSKALNLMDISPLVNAETQFAADDAALALNNRNQGLNRMYQGAMNFQGIRDRNTQARLQRRLMEEQALGTAARSNEDYMRNTIGGLSEDLLTTGIMTGYPDSFGFGGQGSTDGSSGDYIPSIRNRMRRGGRY